MGQKVLKHLPADTVAENSSVAKLGTALGKLPECKSFIERFLRDAIALLKSQEIIKAKGLNLETYQECKELIEVIPQSSPGGQDLLSGWRNSLLWLRHWVLAI